jgi:hypothetical protein
MSGYHWLRDRSTGITYYDIELDGAGNVVAVDRARPAIWGDSPPRIDVATVQKLVTDARVREHQRRSDSAKRAAQTRAARRERMVYKIAERLRTGGTLQRSEHCLLCHKVLSDTESIERGIGSECWQMVLNAISARAKVRP